MTYFTPTPPAVIGEGSAFGGADPQMLQAGQIGDLEIAAHPQNTDMVAAVITALGANPSGVLFEPGNLFPGVNFLNGFATARLVGMFATLAVSVRADGGIVASQPFELPDVSRVLERYLWQSLVITWTQDTGGGDGVGAPLEAFSRWARIATPGGIIFEDGNAAEVGLTQDIGAPELAIEVVTNISVGVRVWGQFVELA